MIQTDAGCYLLAAIVLLLLPVNWILSWLLAALIHECSHIAVLFCFGGKIRNIRISPGGCVIHADAMGFVPGLLSILAGPAGSFLLILLRSFFPLLSVCGFLQGLYNLIPVLPLDGGRILKHILEAVWPDSADKIMDRISVGICFLLLACSILCFLWTNAGLSPILAALLFNIRILPGKIPCKPSRIKVQ